MNPYIGYSMTGDNRARRRQEGMIPELSKI